MNKNFVVGFIVGFTIGYIVVGLFITIARTSKHNMELYNDTRIETDMQNMEMA